MLNLVKSQENNPELQLTKLIQKYVADNTVHTKLGPTNPFHLEYKGYDFFLTFKQSQIKLLEDIQYFAHQTLEHTKAFFLDTYNTPLKQLSLQNLVPLSRQEGVIR